MPSQDDRPIDEEIAEALPIPVALRQRVQPAPQELIVLDTEVDPLPLPLRTPLATLEAFISLGQALGPDKPPWHALEMLHKTSPDVSGHFLPKPWVGGGSSGNNAAYFSDEELAEIRAEQEADQQPANQIVRAEGSKGWSYEGRASAGIRFVGDPSKLPILKWHPLAAYEELRENMTFKARSGHGQPITSREVPIMAFLTHVCSLASEPIDWVETLVFADEPVGGAVRFIVAYVRGDHEETPLPGWISKVIDDHNARISHGVLRMRDDPHR